MTRYGHLIGGEWVVDGTPVPVLDKFTLEPFAEVVSGGSRSVDHAVETARATFEGTRLAPSRRYEILMQAAMLIRERQPQLVETMIAETGFPERDATNDAQRCVQTLTVSAEEAKRLQGELVPLSGAPRQAHRFGFTRRVPVGVVAAITPFNSPLNTVAHKIAPAIAAGNTVVLKPALATPVSAVHLSQALLDAGLPPGALNLVFGTGTEVGKALAEHPSVDFYTFTGSTGVGRSIQHAAGLRRTQMELGSIAATVVCSDADVKRAAERCVAAAFRKAGQVCTSVQIVYAHESVAKEFVDGVVAKTRSLTVGNPHERGTDIGPMISPAEAERVETWVREAMDQGATAHTAVRREGCLMWPVVLTNVKREMKVLSQEVFGPVVSIATFDEVDDAIDAVNSSPYGLSTGFFTGNLETAFRAARGIDSGVVQINDTSSSRVDLMPFGGTKQSGFGREGPRYAAREMTEERLVVINLATWEGTE